MKEFDKYALYENVEELIADINLGLDIEFNYKGQKYWIGGGSKKDCIITKAGENYDDGEEFDTAQELVDKYLIGGKSLRDVSTQIRVTAA